MNTGDLDGDALDGVVVGVQARTMEPTGPTFGGVNDGLLVGLGEEQLTELEIVWPHGDMEPQSVLLAEPVSRTEVSVHRITGIVPCGG